MNNQVVIILDFGGQYNELIARRIREVGVYSIVLSCKSSLEKIREYNPIGMILAGGPNSVYDEGSPDCDRTIFSSGIPILGICYGMQTMCRDLGGTVERCEKREFGKTQLNIENAEGVFDGLDKAQTVLMSHNDMVTILPEGFSVLASTDSCVNAAVCNKEKSLYAFQFHPEVESTKNGLHILKNFLYGICGAVGDYSMQNFLKEKIEEVKEITDGGKVILGLSGGVDSSVCAALISEAIGDRLTCIYVDHGFMRKNESDEIELAFSKRKLNFVRVDASERFLSALSGVSDPETKRKIIGKEFVAVFEEQAQKFGDAKFLAQGTIYPDVIESGTGDAAVIKSHHNVGGLPKDTRFTKIIEPLRSLFKDEVRALGKLLKLPQELYARQPFPGPGLAIRIIGEITREKLDILREADAILREEMKKSRVKTSQYFVVLTNLHSVGVMGDSRTYGYTAVIRAVLTNDFMTCDYAKLPYKLLTTASTRITNEVGGINRVVYDVTSKPPATIEWE